MSEGIITIIDVVKVARSISYQHYTQEGISDGSPTLHGLTSGLDVALTIIEESVGTFKGLSKDTAEKMSAYFRQEAERYGKIEKEIAIWYLSFAEAIEHMFIK